MRQAITTKFLAVTNSRGSRIKAVARKASAHGGEMSATRSYQYGGTEVEHAAAAKMCAEKYGWSGLWVGGGNVDETGFVFVNIGGAPVEHAPLGTENADWFYVPAKS